MGRKQKIRLNFEGVCSPPPFCLAPPGPLYNSISPHRRQPGFRSTTIISSIQSWKLFRGRCYLRTLANNIAKYRSSIIEQYCIVGKSGNLGTPFPPFLKAKFRKILQRLNKSKKFGKILKSRKNTGPGGVLSNFEERGVAKVYSMTDPYRFRMILGEIRKNTS